MLFLTICNPNCQKTLNSKQTLNQTLNSDPNLWTPNTKLKLNLIAGIALFLSLCFFKECISSR